MMAVDRKPCKKQKWRCEEDEPIWRMYMNSYLENERQLERDDKLDHRKAAELSRLPALESYEKIEASQSCFPLNTFNIGAQARLPDRLNSSEKIRIWRNMKADSQNFRQNSTSSIPENEREKWPCIEHDLFEEQRLLKKLKRRKLKGLLPCQKDSEEDLELKEANFTENRELGHARVPVTCLNDEKYFLVDREAGERPGLVNGDYIIKELSSETNEKRVYPEVCLRGLKGMHLIELNRVREKTWKFCFYQGITALLAKTQLRYKFASSINIDYIYDHAWLLFIHMGSMNVQKKIQLDDVVVYNYKYSIELELVDEMVDIPMITDVSWNYMESNLKKLKELKRPELMKTTETLGWEKIKHQEQSEIHPATGEIEDWLESIPRNIHNCLLRTTKFTFAFWLDGNFWYLYNPYRCDKFGFWDDLGCACIMKFCSRTSLYRHIIIMILRAYVFEPTSSLQYSESAKLRTPIHKDRFAIQIFKMIYHCVKVHDLRVLQRQPVKARMQKIWKSEQEAIVQDEANVEKTDWLIKYKVTWARSSVTKKCTGAIEKPRWHQYCIEEIGKLFSLWGEMHPTEEKFATQNRGNQIYACYIICAGMTRIMSPEYWSTKTLDTIVMCGDRYYTLSRLQNGSKENDWSRYLTRHFKIGDMLFEVDILPPIYGKLYTTNSLWKMLEQVFEKFSFIILTCENFCLGIFKSYGAYYSFDVKSIGPPLFDYGHGVPYLIRTTNFTKFLQTLILTIGSIECSEFILNPVDITKTIDMTSPKKCREKSQNV